MALKPVSVTQLNEYISRVLTTDPLLGNIRVSGEITNLKFHGSGHIYFSIKDANSKINCFFPESYVRGLSFMPSDGTEVIINGYINVYKKGGTYTLFVRSMEECGAGMLSLSFDMLKKKLENEGLFAAEHKKPIPSFPKKIGIVTSETGAALQDILKIIKSRTGMVDIMIFPVLVQGADAAADIAFMLDEINENFDDIDTLIVGRGGGSAEDLSSFNEEIVARAIYRSRIPIISAVGHETDFTIADFAADKRAETPTAAAEMAVPNTNELIAKLESDRNSLTAAMSSKLKYDTLMIENCVLDMKNVLNRRLTAAENKMERYRLLLEENNPKAVLSKGYSILTKEDGRVLRSVGDAELEGEYSLLMKDGSLRVKVSEICEG